MRHTKVTSVTLASLAATALTLSACSGDDSSESTPLSTRSAADSASKETETDTESSSTLSESSSEESSTSTSASSSDEDLNKYDGYQTNDFYVAVHNLPGLDSKTAESSPKEYRTEAELLNADETLRVLTFVYIPKVDGEYQPVKSDSDKGLTQAYDSAVDVFEQEGDSFDETEYDTDNLKWRCVEATNTQGGNIDYAICVSSFAGRVVEAHRLVLSEDSGDSDKALDKLLNDFDKALSDLEKK